MQRSRRNRRKRIPREEVACRALVVVDSVQVRKQALANCRRARKTFETAEKALSVFETEIKPAYERWRRESFGPRLQEIGELEARIREFETKLDMLDMIIFRTGCSEKEAMEILEKGLTEERTEPDPEAEREAEQERQQQFREIEEWMEELEKAFEEALTENQGPFREAIRRGFSLPEVMSRFIQAFAEKAEMSEEDCLLFFSRPKVQELLREAGLEEPTEEKNPTEPISNTRVRMKKLMRELAFALHPDQCGEHDQEKLSLWHRVQEAAAAEDLDELEVLHAHMQLLTGDVGPGVSVARLQDLTQLFRQSRAAIRRRLETIKGSPAWRFHQVGERERAALRRDQESVLRARIRTQRGHLRQLEQEWRAFRRRCEGS